MQPVPSLQLQPITWKMAIAVWFACMNPFRITRARISADFIELLLERLGITQASRSIAGVVAPLAGAFNFVVDAYSLKEILNGPFSGFVLILQKESALTDFSLSSLHTSYLAVTPSIALAYWWGISWRQTIGFVLSGLAFTLAIKGLFYAMHPDTDVEWVIIAACTIASAPPIGIASFQHVLNRPVDGYRLVAQMIDTSAMQS